MTMKSIAKLVMAVSFFALLLAFSCGSVSAQGRHPAYLHALTDLRAARAHLEHRGEGELREEEREAIRQIDAAIAEIKRAAIDDGKDLNDHPPVDAGMDRLGRLHRAKELLEKARRDVGEDEDNRFAEGLQHRAYEHIDKSIHEVNEAIRFVESHS